MSEAPTHHFFFVAIFPLYPSGRDIRYPAVANAVWVICNAISSESWTSIWAIPASTMNLLMTATQLWQQMVSFWHTCLHGARMRVCKLETMDFAQNEWLLIATGAKPWLKRNNNSCVSHVFQINVLEKNKSKAAEAAHPANPLCFQMTWIPREPGAPWLQQSLAWPSLGTQLSFPMTTWEHTGSSFRGGCKTVL